MSSQRPHLSSPSMVGALPASFVPQGQRRRGFLPY
jgi:hypothetical protein